MHSEVVQVKGKVEQVDQRPVLEWHSQSYPRGRSLELISSGGVPPVFLVSASESEVNWLAFYVSKFALVKQ